MIECILPNLYRLEIPIPKNPLKATNSYIVKGADRNLIIDTGLNVPEALEAMRAGLAELTVDLAKTDFFVTHMHSDHTGLVPLLKTPTSVVYASGPDATIINEFIVAPSDNRQTYDIAYKNGFSLEEAQQAIEGHPGFTGSPREAMDFTIVSEDTVISVGDFHFTCIETPGHTPGQICLYEQDRKLLISGDHLLGDISPNITHWWGTGDPLGEFIKSLHKIATLPVGLVLPGHRRTFVDCQARIVELVEHHQKRVDEAFEILADGPKTAYQVAGRMIWNMTYRSWGEFPPAQKYFATGEARAHLRHLEMKGLIHQEVVDGLNYYAR